MLSRHLLTLLNIVFNISELLLKVVKTLERFRDLLLLTLILLVGPMGDAKELCIIHSLLSVIHLLNLVLLVSEFIIDAYLAKRLLFEHHDGFREVNLTKIHLNSIREEWLHRHLWLSTLSFLRLHCLHIWVCFGTCISIRGFPGRLFGLIDHLLIGHSSAIFTSWLRRALSEGRKIG